MNESVKREWARVKSLISAMDGEEYDRHRLTWHSASDPVLPDSLWLKDVAASFHGDGDLGCHVNFRRRPPEAGKMWTEASPVPLLTWSLELRSETDAHTWQVRASSQPDDPFQEVNMCQSLSRSQSTPESLSSDYLAKRIRDRLIQHHEDYEAHYKKPI